MIKNTDTSYGIVARLFHWTISIFIIVLLCVGFYMASLPDSADKIRIIGMHKAIGVFVLLLVILRIIWRLQNVQPELPKSLPALLVKLAHANIFLLYFLMLTMPISGALGSLTAGYPISFFGFFTIPAFAVKYEALASICWLVHGTCAWILWWLL